MNLKYLRQARLIALAISLCASVYAQTTAPGATEEKKPLDKTMVLDPFVVTTDNDLGYHAANTLSGTRFNSRVKDLGSAMTIMTPELLNDLGITNMLDAAAFAPNTTRDFGDDADPQGVRSMFFNNLTVRGLNTPDMSRDFFKSGIFADSYNIERLTFTRGANTILFGNANPGGQNDQQLNRADLRRDKGSVLFKTDAEGSHRVGIDENFALIPDKLGLRLDALDEIRHSPIDPQGLKQKRYFAAVTYKPWVNTTVRANYEYVDITNIQGRPFPGFDNITPWVQAGRPLTTGPVIATPATPFTRYANPQLVWVDGNAGGGNPLLNIQNTTQGIGYSIGGVGLSAINTTTEQYYSYEKDPMGTKAGTTYQHGKDVIVSVEQKIGENLTVEASYFHENYLRDIPATYAANQLRVDTNALLSSGAPNPNAGRYYTEESYYLFSFRPNWEVQRYTASYNLDFDKIVHGSWGRWLGHHVLAAMYAREKEFTFQDIAREMNTTPLSGFSTDPLNAQNQIWRRTYLTDSKGGLEYTTDQFGTPITTGGVNSAMKRTQAGNNAMNLNQGKLFAGQSFLFNDRLVLNYGVRKDSVQVYTGVVGKAADGYYQSWRDVSRPTTPTQKFDDDTYSVGAVVHALSWASVFYNQATNFRPPNTAFTTIFDQNKLPPALTGTSKEYGVKLELVHNKLFLSVSHFKTEAKGDISPGYAVPNLMRDANAIWDTFGLLDSPAPDGVNRRTGSRDSRDFTARGEELELAFNPTPGLRLILNGGHVETTLDAQAPFSRAYIALNMPTWLGFNQSAPNSSSTGAAVQGSVNGGATHILTIGELIDDIKVQSANVLLNIGRRSAQTPEYNANFITNYTFQTGALKNFRIGGSAQWKSHFVSGYERVGTTSLIEVDHPYYSAGYYLANFSLGYSRKIMHDRYNWDIQLNVNNIFDKRLTESLTAMDNVTRQPILLRYDRKVPRTIELTNRLSF